MFTIQLDSLDEVNLVLGALNEQPRRLSNGVASKIERQVQAQLTLMTAAPKPEQVTSTEQIRGVLGQVAPAQE